MAPNLLGSTHGLILGAEAQTSDTSGQKLRNTHPQELDTQQRKPSTYSDKSTTSTSDKISSDKIDKLEIVWRNVGIFIALHLLFVYFVYLLVTFQMKLVTFLFAYTYSIFAGFGITAGAHRLWAHRTYKANLPLRIFLMLAQSAALQNDIHEWARDHRVHHKFTDTNADPHNVSRGFFFAHIGWLMCKKHKDVLVKGKTVDMSDVLADPVVKFQMKHYYILVLITSQLIPTLIPWYFLGEHFWISFVASWGRYVLSLNGTWLVNSAAHIWGTKPYDKTIKPTENKFVAVIAFGEGWHNYHHVFPWDYKAAELGNYNYNFTTCFLDFMAKIGWATELKTASEEMIRKRLQRTGDGTWPDVEKLKNNNQEQPKNHHHHHHHDDDMIWGWGDKDMDNEEITEIKKMNRIRA